MKTVFLNVHKLALFF